MGKANITLISPPKNCFFITNPREISTTLMSQCKIDVNVSGLLFDLISADKDITNDAVATLGEKQNEIILNEIILLTLSKYTISGLHQFINTFVLDGQINCHGVNSNNRISPRFKKN